jgi:hypothetical protein
MHLTIVIPINTDSAANAEMLIDWIRQLNQNEKRGSALLVYDNVHDELQMRLRVCADLTFTSFDELVAPCKLDASACHKRNTQFLCAAEYAQKTYRIPWMWLDPICIPTRQTWLNEIEEAYTGQPKRYMGTHIKATPEGEPFLHPVSIYHMGVYNDGHKAVLEAMEKPFEMSLGPIIGPKSNKWRLVQPLKIIDESDFEKVWEEAAVVFGDASGAYIERLRENGVHLPAPLTFRDLDKACDEVLSKHAASDVYGGMTLSPPPPPRIDRRTKAGRALNAKAQA